MRLFNVYIMIVFFYISCDNKSGVYLNIDPDVNYVGMHQCAACHQEKYNTFIL